MPNNNLAPFLIASLFLLVSRRIVWFSFFICSYDLESRQPFPTNLILLEYRVRDFNILLAALADGFILGGFDICILLWETKYRKALVQYYYIILYPAFLK